MRSCDDAFEAESGHAHPAYFRLRSQGGEEKNDDKTGTKLLKFFEVSRQWQCAKRMSPWMD